MKKLCLLIALVCWFGFGFTYVSLAHDQLPSSVRSYLEANPTATAEMIREFAQTAGATEISELQIDPRTDGYISFIVNYTELGFFHILSGVDHLLFLFAMILFASTLTVVARLSLAFTIAHSVTFIMAGTTTIAVSAAIVEPIIALSIALVAAAGLWQTLHQHPRLRSDTMAVIFFFGLFHGLGFAGLLLDIKIPEDFALLGLVFFNVGIELGQLLVILILFPLGRFACTFVMWPYVQIALATMLISIGSVWSLTRVLESF